MNQNLSVDIEIFQHQDSQLYTLKSIQSGDEQLQIISNKQSNQQHNYKSGHWSHKEHIKYIMFLQYFCDLFALKHNKKLWKIFTIMSSFIKTRNSSQCRSHHQKTQRKYSSIQQILQQQKLKYHNYQLQYTKIKKILKRLPIKSPQQKIHQRASMQITSIKFIQDNHEINYKKNTASENQITQIKLLSEPIINIKAKRQITSTNYPKIQKKQCNSQCSIQQQQQKPPLIVRKKIKWATLEPPFHVYRQQDQKQAIENQKKKNQSKTNDTYVDNKVKVRKIRSSLPVFQQQSCQLNVFGPVKMNDNSEIQQYINNKCSTSPRKSSKQSISDLSLSNFPSNLVQNSLFISEISNQQFPQPFFDNQFGHCMKKHQPRKSRFNYKQEDALLNTNQQKFLQANYKKSYQQNIQKDQIIKNPFSQKKQQKKVSSLPSSSYQPDNQFDQQRVKQEQCINYSDHIQSSQSNQSYPTFYPTATIFYSPYQNPYLQQYYQIKNWVEFCVYFWVWRLKMNMLYYSQIQ